MMSSPSFLIFKYTGESNMAKLTKEVFHFAQAMVQKGIEDGNLELSYKGVLAILGCANDALPHVFPTDTVERN